MLVMRSHILLCLFFFFFPVTSECHENGFTCNACCGIFPDNFLFRCQCCNLKLDSFCALYEPTREELHHFSHFHPLETVLLDKEVFPYICAACQTNCIGPTYTCKRCNWSSHKRFNALVTHAS
jgi:hypothetical protein